MIAPLLRNIYFIAKEDLAILKYEVLNKICVVHNFEFNENYINRKSGREILGYIAEPLREKKINELKESEYFGISLDSSMDVSWKENLVIYCEIFKSKKSNF